MGYCQLVQGTADGFLDEYVQYHSSGTDPPESHFEDNMDPPHYEDSFIEHDLSKPPQ